MAKEFSDIGNDNGFIYVTGPDGLAASMVSNLANNGDGLRTAKLMAVQAAATSANLISTGSVKIDTIGGSILNITGIGIAAINQMSGPVNVNGLTEAQAAEAVAVNINEHIPGAGDDFTAAAIGDTIFLFAPVSSGSSPNGDTVTPTTDDPGNITFTSTDMAGGADANSSFDEAHGFRFFLDADYAAAATSCTGEGAATEGDLSNAIEITNNIITIITSFQTDSVEILNDAVTLTRKGIEANVEVNTQASAATDDLSNINPAGFSEGDIIYLRGVNVARIITLDETGNIDLAGGTTFVTGGYEKVIALQLWAKGGAAQNVLTWFEVSRSTQAVSTTSEYRVSGLPVPLEGSDVIPASTGGTTTLIVGTDELVQAISGVATLASDFKVVLSTAGAIVGDVFRVKYAAQITKGAFDVTIGGVAPYTLTERQALIGGWCAWSYYDGAAWQTTFWPDTGSVQFALESVFIDAGAITVPKLTTELATEVETLEVSFETDEIGDQKITMPYAGTVVDIDYAVSKLIEATDDASVVAKDNAAGVMATTSIVGGSAVGTIFSAVAPTINNTFVAGDVLTFTTAKPTIGGKVRVSLKITRT